MTMFKNINLLSLALFSFIIVMSSCGQSGPKKITTENGFELLIIEDKEGDKIKEGEGIVLQVATFLDDSLVNRTESEEDMTPIEMRSDSMILAQENPVFDALMYLSEGDSAVVSQPISSLNERAQAQLGDKYDEIVYELRIKDVLTSEQLQERKQQQQQEAMRIMQERNASFQMYKPMVDSLNNLYKAGNLSDNMTDMGNGLQVYTIEEGSGATPDKGDQITVEYIGQLAEDNKVFDQSFRRQNGMTTSIGVGQLIRGWDQALLEVKEGSKVVIFIPSELGYGERGQGQTIPPSSDLVFYVDVKEIK